jgi:LmbE family N-acetylglucosaminyl deacetylase
VRTIAVLLLLLVWPADARVRSVRRPAPERILWIGAHPDDEALLAPILGQSCMEGSDVCSMLVMTRGERGDCALPGGCGDLGALRSSEMQKAAVLFHAHLALWTFSDVMSDVAATWSTEASGRAALISRIESLITAERPTIIYTFDPNHGSSCHPAHRAVGELVIAAVGKLKPAPRLVFVETIIQPGYVFASATPDARWLSGDWSYLIRDVQIHASQFKPEEVETLRRTPPEQRRVWLSTAPAQKYNCGT